MILVTVCRTLFYQFLLIAVGLSIGFILNAEYIGWKSTIIERSVTNIFNPTQYDEDICKRIKNWGATRIWAELGRPSMFEVLEDGLLAEEYYIGKFKYTNVDTGETEVKIIPQRVRWKPWEYYYTDPTPESNEELLEYLDNGDLNSKESDKAFLLYDELKKQE
jgi:hypothetical protein